MSTYQTGFGTVHVQSCPEVFDVLDQLLAIKTDSDEPILIVEKREVGEELVVHIGYSADFPYSMAADIDGLIERLKPYCLRDSIITGIWDEGDYNLMLEAPDGKDESADIEVVSELFAKLRPSSQWKVAQRFGYQVSASL